MKKRQCILIVEDELINRKILYKILSNNYDILEAANGADGWELLTEHKSEISAVLLDIVMPVMDGYAFLEKARQASMTELPIIIMTGETDTETEQKALDAGAWDFVTKPYNPKVLMSRLRNAIARRQVSVYEKMQKMAEHDALTGLQNRNHMFARTRQMLDEHPGQQFVFLRVDIDHFALYNSAFGEAEGDRLLCFIARLFDEIAKDFSVSTYGRMNSDIFCVCTPYSGKPDTLERVVNNVQGKLAEFRRNYLLEVSVGVYIIEDPSLTIEECYLRASLGAQRCKSQYGKHIGFYDKKSKVMANQEIEIINEMQSALEQEQFVVYFQPKVSLATDKACGAEALVRWDHPERGLVSPGVFIPVFERNGFIAKLDYYVWEHTCMKLKKWKDEGYDPYPVSVNISRVSLYNPQLVDVLVGLVEKYQIDYELLQLEITESAIMTNQELMQKTIHDMRQAGFTILMDDFGSGYSSLNTLKDIEVDILKVDMKFLPIGGEVEKAEIILASIIKMTKWLGMSVVVEGVETREQRDFLEGAGCDYVQGYYYSRPIPSEEYESSYVMTGANGVEEREQEIKEVAPAHNVTLLVIDDVEMDRVMIQEYFKERYHVHSCANAEDALVYLKHNKHQVRLILVDNVMPGMSGLDFLTYCQDDTTLSTIPQIMITANDNVTDQVNAFQHGAYDYITKPLVREVVEARVNHVMDISRQYRIFENWEYDYRNLAERDRATGLLNKTAFQEMGLHMLQSNADEQHAMMIFDFDDFKLINDKYGHLAGDTVIQCVADILKKEFRKTDLLGRFGGDEFMVLMSGLTTREIARKKAEEIIKNVTINCAKEHHLNAGISVGIAFSEENDTLNSLFGRADEAMYEAKRTGKGRVAIYGEKVPPVIDDDKPLVLICGEDPQLYPAVALAYGDTAAFVNVSSMEDLRENFEQYEKRICTICLDMQKKVMPDSDEFYQFIRQHGGGISIPILGVCKEGDMEHLRAALQLNIQDIITLPPHTDIVQRRLARAIMVGCLKNT